MPGIFVSYRRDDAAGWAGRLSADLREGLGGAAVFMDIDAIPPGVPYDDYIAQAVGSCDVLIALIGPRWLSVADKAGRRRLDDPSDLTRLEILAALQRDIRVIPALVGGAEMPPADELPQALRPLARRQAYELADHRWNEDCARLVRVLKPIVHGGRSPAGRALASVGLLLALLASGYGAKLWLGQRPHVNPTPMPTALPTLVPTAAPTPAPTREPTPVPTLAPSAAPTRVPTPSPTESPAERVRLSASELAFGSRPVGREPEPGSGKRVFIKNLTGAPIELKYVVRGPHARDFPLKTSNCDDALRGGMTLTARDCFVGFSFIPTEAGTRQAFLVIQLLGGQNELYRVALGGRGVAAHP